MNEKLKTADRFGATVQRRGGMEDAVGIRGFFEAVLRDRDGKVKWRDTIRNLVTTVGKNDVLNKYLAGSAYTQTLRMGLKGAGTALIADTQASHANWVEQGLANAPVYTGNRPVVVMGAAAGGSSVSSGVVFNFTSGGTVAGAFINNGGSATKDDTTGTLYAAGDFSGGSKTVGNGDSLTITYTGTLT